MLPTVLSTLPQAGFSPARSMPGVRIGQYELIRLLGQGGMGAVHLARDLRLGRLVAIKLLSAQAASISERFLAEARATARCHHEHIVVIHELGQHEGQPYMVLEYLEGQTLRQWLLDHAAAMGPRARVPPARAIELMLPVVRALAYAHEQGLVHRDLKPENVMLTRAGVIKVLDFSLAKLVTAPVPDPGVTADAAGPVSIISSLAGTLPYMSPEQWTLGPIDHRSDVWTVGVMLFELVAGEHPVLGPGADPSALRTIADLHTPMPSTGERVPELGPLAAIIDRCLIKAPEHRTASARVLLAELEALAPDRRALPVGDDGNPFTGLAAFQEADAGRFFGRDRDIALVVAELRGRPLVAVIGPSGAGKSSLVRAGVIPALKRSGEGWDAYTVRPGREPLAALVPILAHEDSAEPGEPAAGAALQPSVDRLRSETGFLATRLRTRAMRKRRRVIVFVDQLEEIYTLGVAPAERAAFLACLTAVADDVTSPLRVLVSMRSDFLDRLTEDRRFGTELTHGLVLLPPMDRDGMREALIQPLAASEHRFEPPALVDRMVDALATTPSALPLLQFTAARLWERRDRDRRMLTEASYEQLGGVAGALAMHADAVLAGMTPAQRSLARAVLERLVTPERTRALVGVAELHALHSDRALVDGVVHHLTVMRLVAIEPGLEGADPTVELVHESLIDRWPTLMRWLDENQDDAAELARLRSAAREWERSGHAAGLLWTGEVAREADAWRQRYQRELAPIEQRYLAAVRAAAERTLRGRRWLFGGSLAAVVLIAIAMAWLAWQQTAARQEAIALADQAAEEATRARDATRMAAMQSLSADPTSQLALLRELERIHAPPPGAARDAKRLLNAGVALAVLTGPAMVHSAAFSPDGRRIVSASSDGVIRVWSADGSGVLLVLRGHDTVAASAAYSPDGRRIVSTSLDKTVRVWSADGSGTPVILRGHGDVAVTAAFSPDGQRIVSASYDRTIRVWNADGSGTPVILRGHDDRVHAAAFSRDGQRIVSASQDKTVRVWNADGSGEPRVLRGHGEPVERAVFSPDGQRIASASQDKTVRVWNADGSGEPLVLRHEQPVTSAAFSPDGQRIVSASQDNAVRVWSAAGRDEPLVLRGHDGVVTTVEFSPDGQRIVSASQDSTMRVWSAAVRREPLVLRGHDGVVSSVEFSPDGQRIVSTGLDRTVRIWSIGGETEGSREGHGSPLILRGHTENVRSAAFSPDGQHIVSASEDRTLRVWRVDGRGEPLVLRGHENFVARAKFSPDGRRIVSASFDSTLRIWNADGSGEPRVLRGHEQVVIAAAFSPDGRHIVSASADKTLRVWSADGSGEPLVLRGHDQPVYSAAFSPDGRRIVSAAEDGTARVWRADGSGTPLILRCHGQAVMSAVFSTEGRHIAATCAEDVLIWRADGAGEPVILPGHEHWTADARFSPDDRRIASASIDGTIRVWHDLTPVPLDDPRLWAATSYCMPIERRTELLGVSEAQARRDRQRCLELVERAARRP